MQSMLMGYFLLFPFLLNILGAEYRNNEQKRLNGRGQLLVGVTLNLS